MQCLVGVWAWGNHLKQDFPCGVDWVAWKVILTASIPTELINDLNSVNYFGLHRYHCSTVQYKISSQSPHLLLQRVTHYMYAWSGWNKIVDLAFCTRSRKYWKALSKVHECYSKSFWAKRSFIALKTISLQGSYATITLLFVISTDATPGLRSQFFYNAQR